MTQDEQKAIEAYLNDLTTNLGQGDIDNVVKELKTITLPDGYKNQALLISARNYELKNQIIKGTVSHEEKTIERNKISDALLALINLIKADNLKEYHWFFDDDNFENQLMTSISKITENVYNLTTNTQEGSDAQKNKVLLEVFSKLRDSLHTLLNHTEKKEMDGNSWGEITAILDNAHILLADKIDVTVLDNLQEIVRAVKTPRRMMLIPVVAPFYEKDLVQAIKTAIGYIDGLKKVLETV